MSFADAVRDALSKYVTFTGRSSRSAYWWFYLFGILVAIATWILDVALNTNYIFNALASLALLLPNLAVSVRRLHDTTRSGWWLLIGFIPLIGWIVLIVFLVQGSAPPNQYGSGPDSGVAPASASGLT